MKNLTIILLALALTGCNGLYTNKEVRQFEKGDTVYVKIINKTLPAIVKKNDTEKELVTVLVPNYYDPDFSIFWMEYVYKYKKF